MKYFMGIDPGQSGGIACITEERELVFAVKMPSNERDIYKEIQGKIYFCLIEKVHAMPKQGVSSTFKFGMGYGGLRMALIGNEVPFDEVTPQKWQKGLSIPKRIPHDKTMLVKITKGKNKGKMREKKYGGETDSQWKNRLKSKAQQLFPSFRVTLETADALLIAEYCRMRQAGLLDAAAC